MASSTARDGRAAGGKGGAAADEESRPPRARITAIEEAVLAVLPQRYQEAFDAVMAHAKKLAGLPENEI